MLDFTDKNLNAIAIERNAANNQVSTTNTQAERSWAVKPVDIFSINSEFVQDVTIKLNFVVEHANKFTTQPLARGESYPILAIIRRHELRRNGFVRDHHAKPPGDGDRE